MPDEREKLIALALKSDNLQYSRLRKELSLPETDRFNMVRYSEAGMEESEKKAKFPEMQSYHKIRKALDAVSKGHIIALSHDQLDQIGTILSLYKADDKRRTALQAIGLSESEIICLLPLSFSKVGNLSLATMKKLIPCLEAGNTYDKACIAVYRDFRGHCGDNRQRLLSFNELRKNGSLDAITNPVVLHAVSQTCKVVNAIIRKYGPPQMIRVELAREMSRNFNDRHKMDKQIEENHAANDRLMEQIEEIKGGRPTGQDLVKFKLFREQNEICLYSEEELTTFKARNLVDTQYITRTVYNLLNDNLEFAPSPAKKKVVAVNGAITDYIRKRVDLRKVREDGDLHHAMDAVVIGITSDRLIHQISNYSKRRELGRKIMVQYVDLETGELMSQEALMRNTPCIP